MRRWKYTSVFDGFPRPLPVLRRSKEIDETRKLINDVFSFEPAAAAAVAVGYRELLQGTRACGTDGIFRRFYYCYYYRCYCRGAVIVRVGPNGGQYEIKINYLKSGPSVRRVRAYLRYGKKASTHRR